MSEPIRTCVGCRRRESQPALVRLCVADGRVVADRRRRLPGRGAYVHARRECVERGLQGGIARALRRSVQPSTAGLIAAVLEGVIATD